MGPDPHHVLTGQNLHMAAQECQQAQSTQQLHNVSSLGLHTAADALSVHGRRSRNAPWCESLPPSRPHTIGTAGSYSNRFTAQTGITRNMAVRMPPQMRGKPPCDPAGHPAVRHPGKSCSICATFCMASVHLTYAHYGLYPFVQPRFCSLARQMAAIAFPTHDSRVPCATR